jgi:hypothetical protein
MGRADIVIIGLGLPREFVNELLLAAETGAVHGAPAGISELVIDTLRRDEPLERRDRARL